MSEDKAASLAVGLYVVADRDFCDFMDMLPEASMESLVRLHEMCTQSADRSDTDHELNKLMLGPIERELENRRSPGESF